MLPRLPHCPTSLSTGQLLDFPFYLTPSRRLSDFPSYLTPLLVTHWQCLPLDFITTSNSLLSPSSLPAVLCCHLFGGEVSYKDSVVHGNEAGLFLYCFPLLQCPVHHTGSEEETSALRARCSSYHAHVGPSPAHNTLHMWALCQPSARFRETPKAGHAHVGPSPAQHTLLRNPPVRPRTCRPLASPAHASPLGRPAHCQQRRWFSVVKLPGRFPRCTAAAPACAGEAAEEPWNDEGMGASTRVHKDSVVHGNSLGGGPKWR